MDASVWRCFVALPIGSDLRERLATTVDEWRANGPPDGLRWVEPDSWHLTLAFLGATPAEDVPRIARRLAEVVAGYQPATQSTGGLGAFPSVSAARVLWYGVADPDRRLARLAREVRRAIGVPGKARFRPHLTLARTRAPISLRDWLASASAPPGEIRVERVRLYRSHLGHGPARYEVLAEAPLRRQPARMEATGG